MFLGGIDCHQGPYQEGEVCPVHRELDREDFPEALVELGLN